MLKEVNVADRDSTTPCLFSSLGVEAGDVASARTRPELSPEGLGG